MLFFYLHEYMGLCHLQLCRQFFFLVSYVKPIISYNQKLNNYLLTSISILLDTLYVLKSLLRYILILLHLFLKVILVKLPFFRICILISHKSTIISAQNMNIRLLKYKLLVQPFVSKKKKITRHPPPYVLMLRQFVYIDILHCGLTHFCLPWI